MIDINLLRENPEKFKKATADKQMDPSLVDKVLDLDSKRKQLVVEIEKLRARRNEIAKKGEASNEGRKIKEKLKNLEPELKKIGIEFEEHLYKIPNLVSEDVPVGKDENENKVIRKWSKPKKFDFQPKDHIEIGEHLGLIDVETSSKVSGTRFCYLKNEAVLLQFAIIQFTFETLTNQNIIDKIAKSVGNPSIKPFIPVIPPVIAKGEVVKKMDRYYPIEERYYYENDDVMFIGSAEHTLGPMHMDEVLNENRLPIRYVGYSTAFRREAGSYGKDTRGIIRVHQFDKIEMETFTTPKLGMVEQDFIVAVQEYLVQQLEIPYQVVAICTGDMGKPDFRQIDIEMWMPGQEKYRETHTSDYMTDYQARRLNTRVRTKDGMEYVYMNDATAFAIGRTLIAILENYQQKDGSVVIPKVLQKWMGKEKIVAGLPAQAGSK